MRYVADGLLVEVEMFYYRLRERQKAFHVLLENLDSLIGFQNLNQSAESHRAENIAGRFAGVRFAGLDDLVTGHTFGPWKRCVHAQGTAQQDDEEYADQPAYQQHQRGFPIMRAQIRPQAMAVDFHHHESRGW